MTDQEIEEKAINDVATAYGIDPEYLRRLLEDVANKMPPHNVVLSLPAFKPTLDEKKMRAILKSSEMHSRFSMHDFLEQSIIHNGQDSKQTEFLTSSSRWRGSRTRK